MFAPLFECSEHGRVWRVFEHNEIDSDRDEIYEYECCEICYRAVTPVLVDGKPLLHALTDEEMEIELRFANEEDEY